MEHSNTTLEDEAQAQAQENLVKEIKVLAVNDVNRRANRPTRCLKRSRQASDSRKNLPKTHDIQQSDRRNESQPRFWPSRSLATEVNRIEGPSTCFVNPINLIRLGERGDNLNLCTRVITIGLSLHSELFKSKINLRPDKRLQRRGSLDKAKVGLAITGGRKHTIQDPKKYVTMTTQTSMTVTKECHTQERAQKQLQVHSRAKPSRKTIIGLRFTPAHKKERVVPNRWTLLWVVLTTSHVNQASCILANGTI